MHRYSHVREKAVALRNQKYSLDEIASMLSVNKSTVFYWIKDMERPPLDKQKNAEARAKAVKSVVLKYKKLRDDAYQQAIASAAEDLKDASFRDFICLYMGEGSKSDRNWVGFINSDPELVRISHRFIKKMTKRKIRYVLHLYPDHDKTDEIGFWASCLHIDPSLIMAIPKPGANKLKRRNTRLKHGIFSFGTADTYLKSRIDAYTDFIKGQWTSETRELVTPLVLEASIAQCDPAVSDHSKKGKGHD